MLSCCFRTVGFHEILAVRFGIVELTCITTGRDPLPAAGAAQSRAHHGLVLLLGLIIGGNCGLTVQEVAASLVEDAASISVAVLDSFGSLFRLLVLELLEILFGILGLGFDLLVEIFIVIRSVVIRILRMTILHLRALLLHLVLVLLLPVLIVIIRRLTFFLMRLILLLFTLSLTGLIFFLNRHFALMQVEVLPLFQIIFIIIVGVAGIITLI